MTKQDEGEQSSLWDIRSHNYVSTEFSMTRIRWAILGFLFFSVNVFRLPGWPLGLFNLLLAGSCLYNCGIAFYLKRKKGFSVRLALVSLSLDVLAISIVLFFTGRAQSPYLFLWYLVLFGAGLRFGYAGSFALQVPIGLIFTFLLYYGNAAVDRESLSLLAAHLFAVTTVPLVGSIFGREEQYAMEVMADIRKESITDRLTGLFNYAHFLDELKREHSRALRNGSHFSIIIFDLDFFKQVNDTYGHEKGNLLLKGVADILKASARKMDTVARYGGEEFVVLMPDSKGAEMEVAERIRAKIEQAEFTGIADKPIRITISGGVCTYPRDARSVNELLDKADRGLYMAKTCGRNRTSYCEPVGR